MIRTTETTTTYYQRPVTTALSLLDTLETTAARFGIDPPVRVRGVDAVLAAEPRPEDVLRDAAGESLTTTDAAAWLEDTVARYQRAQIVEQITRQLSGHRDRLGRVRATEALAIIAPDLSKHAATLIKKMTKAAADLPTDHPLDAEAVLDAGAGTQRTVVAEGLADLAALAGLYETTAPPPGITPRLASVLPVVNVPDVPVERIERLTRRTLNPHPERDAIRQLARDLDERGIDAALIGVMRGDYAGITLEWSPSIADHAARTQRATRANTQQSVESPTHADRLTALA